LKLAKNSTAWISVPLFVTAVLAALGSWYATGVALVGSLIMIFFHRDPDRTPEGEGMISPADGRIVEAGPDRVSVFMGPTDVHVNRSPVDGVVRSIQFMKGGHVPAFTRLAGKNQQNRIVIQADGEAGCIEVRQIAGTIVREIICYVQPGERVLRGQRIGMIRFGSRVEVTVPKKCRIMVKVGDKVHAGETIIAVRST